MIDKAKRLVENMRVCCGDIPLEDEVECDNYCINPHDVRNGEMRFCREWLIKDAADMIESLSKELKITQDLAERRLNRKNMYKERSERSLFEKERYRLDLEQVKRERDAAISDLTGECTVCKNSNKCVKYPCYCINGSAWEWRGVPENK